MVNQYQRNEQPPLTTTQLTLKKKKKKKTMTCDVENIQYTLNLKCCIM